MIKKMALFFGSVLLFTLVLFSFLDEEGALENKEVELISPRASIQHDTDILNLISSKDTNQSKKVFGEKPSSYKFSMDVNAFGQQLDEGKVVAEQPILKIAVTGSLFLETKSLKKGSDATRVFVKLSGINTNIGNDNSGEQNLDDEWIGRSALEIPFAFDIDRQGKVKSLHLSSNDEDVSAGIKRVIASRMQFVTDDSGRSNWKVEESDETGIHVAEYSSDSNFKFSKSVLRYIKLAQFKDSEVMHSIRDHQGKSSYQFESTGLLYSIDSLMNVSTSMKGMNMRSSTAYNLEWTGFNARPVAFDLTSEYESFPPNIIARFKKQDFYPGEKTKSIDLYDFVAQISTIDPDKDFERRWALRDQFIEGIKNDPSMLADVSAMIANNLNDRDVIFLLGALTDAGTSESQQALVNISSDSSLSLDVRQQAISHIGLVDAPSQEAIEYLSSVANDDELAPELREPALLALGNSVRSGFNEENLTDFSADPAVYEEAVRELEEGFQNATELGESNAYIAALGNAGSKSSSNLLLEMTSSDNETERRMAVDSLRFIDDPRVDSTLMDLMHRDSSVSVQIDAIKTTIYRDKNTKMDDNLFSLVRESDNPQVRIAALESLGFRVSDSDALMKEMVYRSRYDEHEMVREFAQSVVDAHANSNATNLD